MIRHFKGSFMLDVQSKQKLSREDLFKFMRGAGFLDVGWNSRSNAQLYGDWTVIL